MKPKPSLSATLARIVALLLAVAFILLFPVSLIARSVTAVVFSADRIEGVIRSRLEGTEAYHRVFAAVLMGDGLQEGSASMLAGALGDLEPRDLNAALDLLIPPGWAMEQINAVLEDAYRWIDDERAAPALSVDLRPLRDNLISGGARGLVELVIDSWPACTVDQIAAMMQEAGATGEITIQSCEPSEPVRSMLLEFATGVVVEQAQAMPPALALGEELRRQPADELMALKEQVRMLRAFGRGAWFLAFSLLGLVIVLVVRSWRQLGRWWGIPLILAGVLAFLFAALGGTWLVQAVNQPANGAGSADLGLELLAPVVSGVVDEVLGQVLLLAILVTLGGVALLAGGAWITRRAGRAAAVPTPAAPTEPLPTQPREGGDTPSGMFA